MIITRPNKKSEYELFYENFKECSYRIETDTLGNIRKIETDDKKIIEWLKEKGLIES